MLTILVAACVTVTACDDKKQPTSTVDNGQSVSVSISVEAPFQLQPEPIEYKNTQGGAWFTHALTIENTSERTIAVSGDLSPQFINENKMLVSDSGKCGIGPAAPGGELPTVTCASSAPLPTDVEPHTSAKLRTVAVYKDLNGMSALTAGEYKADATIHWKFATESEARTDVAKIVYSVK